VCSSDLENFNLSYEQINDIITEVKTKKVFPTEKNGELTYEYDQNTKELSILTLPCTQYRNLDKAYEFNCEHFAQIIAELHGKKDVNFNPWGILPIFIGADGKEYVGSEVAEIDYESVGQRDPYMVFNTTSDKLGLKEFKQFVKCNIASINLPSCTTCIRLRDDQADGSDQPIFLEIDNFNVPRNLIDLGDPGGSQIWITKCITVPQSVHMSKADIYYNLGLIDNICEVEDQDFVNAANSIGLSTTLKNSFQKKFSFPKQR
jgi:hypothetical protein